VNHPADNFNQYSPDTSEARQHVVFLSGPGGRTFARPGIFTKILLSLVAIAVLALAASFAVVIAAIFAGLILLLLAIAGLRYLWRRLTGRGSRDGFAADIRDSGVHFSGRIVVTSSGPTERTATSSAKQVIDVPVTTTSRITHESTDQSTLH
jgi:hypothetical protein